MTHETLDFLSALLDRVTISAGDPEFEAIAVRIVKARAELREALEASRWDANVGNGQ
jgi:hypothetical protein